MRNPKPFLIAAGIAAVSMFASADDIYKCVKNGKTSYLTEPKADSGQCAPAALRDDKPDPAEVARLLEQRKAREEANQKANEAAMKERELRAQELAASAAARNARAAEQSLRLQQQAPSALMPDYPYYPYSYYPPYWGGGIVAYPGNGQQRPREGGGVPSHGQPHRSPSPIVSQPAPIVSQPGRR